MFCFHFLNDCFSMVPHAMYKIQRDKGGHSKKTLSHPEVSFLCSDVCLPAQVHVHLASPPPPFPPWQWLSLLCSPWQWVLEVLGLAPMEPPFFFPAAEPSVIWMNCRLRTSPTCSPASHLASSCPEHSWPLPGQSQKLSLILLFPLK